MRVEVEKEASVMFTDMLKIHLLKQTPFCSLITRDSSLKVFAEESENVIVDLI